MKKAQIKMFETIGVLIVFFFLLVAGFVFYFNIQSSSLQKQLAQQTQLKSLKSAQRAVFLPELECSFVSVQRENCFDRYKLAVLQDVISKNTNIKNTYFKTFGYSNISVREVYPEGGVIDLYNNPPEEFSTALKSRLPVLLYDPVTRDSAFAVMEVTTYAQG